jgi:hypothetical protein
VVVAAERRLGGVEQRQGDGGGGTGGQGAAGQRAQGPEQHERPPERAAVFRMVLGRWPPDLKSSASIGA